MTINLLVEAKLKETNQLRFVVHEHKADKVGLHYDLRLEHNGVLKSWATRKLPDLVSDQTQKISLFEQPDHQMDWLNFSGEIQDGYGKGTVKIWDSGTYILHTWSPRINGSFRGSKLNGLYTILPLEQNWLMFKKKEQ